LVGEFDSSGAIVSSFHYAAQSHSPDLMIKGSNKYYFVKDHLGSVRLVVNSSTGAIDQRIDYDEFGQVLNDSNPSFQPFGFAGGLYDPDTRLVQFGARSYDPETGRWTSKDPIRFQGGDTNLYLYSNQDPVNFIDTNGEFAIALVPVFMPAIVNVAIGVASGVTAGYLISELINVFSRQDKRLSQHEIDKLKEAGVDPEELKKNLGKSKSDLFKRPSGDICVKPKDGSGPGEDVGLNIKDLIGIKR
jgi:RHS repeat-associated protein